MTCCYYTSNKDNFIQLTPFLIWHQLRLQLKCLARSLRCMPHSMRLVWCPRLSFHPCQRARLYHFINLEHSSMNWLGHFYILDMKALNVACFERWVNDDKVFTSFDIDFQWSDWESEFSDFSSFLKLAQFSFEICFEKIIVCKPKNIR